MPTTATLEPGTQTISLSLAHDLKPLPLAEIVQRCREEIRLCLSSPGRQDLPFGFELFRRALCGDDYAWYALYDLYSSRVLMWIRAFDTHARLSHDDQADLVHITFAKFSRSIPPEKTAAFAYLAQYLRYLKCCARSVVLDELRSRNLCFLHEATLESAEEECAIDDPTDAVLSRLSDQELWQAVQALLQNEQERLVVQYVLLQGISPRLVCSRFSSTFSSIDAVYKARRNVIDRLRRNKHFLQVCSCTQGLRGDYDGAS